MPFPSIFDAEVTDKLIQRVEQLQPDTKPQWGKMNSAQMMAHVNATYDVSYGVTGKRLNGFMRFMLKLFVKPMVIGEKPYKKNSRTAPYFVIADERDFQEEKGRLIAYLKKSHSDGVQFFEGKDNPSFGKLTAQEWSNQFYKHLDYHLDQFGQ